MSNTALNIPEGFQDTSALVFQNLSNWKKADATGVMVRGVYLGQTEPDIYGKENYKIEATEEGSSFDKEGNEIKFAKGTIVIINTCGSLDKKLKPVQLGREVIVIYNGTNIMDKGKFSGKEAHNFLVLVK